MAASGTDIIFDTNISSSGIGYNTGTGVFTLTAEKTYRITSEISFQNYSTTGYLLVQLVDATSNTAINTQINTYPYNSGFNEVNNLVSDIIYTPNTNQTVKFRVVNGTPGITAEHRGAGFSRASIVQINPTVTVNDGSSGTSGFSGSAGSSGTSGTAGTAGTGFTTVTNPGVNRMLVANGTSGDSAIAVSGVTYDGSTMNVTGDINLTGSIIMSNRPAFRVTGTGGAIASVTVLSGSTTTVDYSQGNAWNNSNGTFTAPIAGLYQVNLVARCAGNANPTAQVIVYKNNTTISPLNGIQQIMLEWAANTTANHIGGSTITKLEAGDTLKAIVTVGSISFDVNDNFSVAYIG